MKLDPRAMALPALITVVVVLAVIAAIVVLGGPSGQRARKMDEVRVRNLGSIETAIGRYATRHKALPATLDEVAKEQGPGIPRNDPVTDTPYGYQVLSDESYRLCADFASDAVAESQQVYRPYTDATWAHRSGHQCFEKTIEKNGR